MAELSYRENTLLKVNSSDSTRPDFAGSYDVTAYPVGAIATATSTDTTIPVDAGHSFRAGDKLLNMTGLVFSGTNTVASVTATQITMDSSFSVILGDALVNLGPDTGTSTPAYDASHLTIYSDADGTTAVSNNRVTCGANGEYSYYHKGDGRFWELVRNGSAVVVDVIKGFGAVAGRYNTADYVSVDGSTDDAPGIQSALNAAQNERSILYLANGTSILQSKLSVGSTAFAVEGRGKTHICVLKAGASFPSSSAIFHFTDSSTNNRSRFESFQLNGNSKADYGILSNKLAHCTFRGVWVFGTLVAAISVSNGWCNLFDDVECSTNTGDGLVLNSGGNNNAVTISNCKLFANDGWGLQIFSARNVHIDGSLFEVNKLGGALVNYSSGVDFVGCYCEGNAATGKVFTTPSHTVKADFVFNGSTDAAIMSSASPNRGIVLSGNYHSVGVAGKAEIAYQLISVQGALISGNYVRSSTAGNDAILIGYYNDNVCNVSDLVVSSNSVEATDATHTIANEAIISVENITGNFEPVFGIMSWRFSENNRGHREGSYYDGDNDKPLFDSPRPVNYFTDNISRWSIQSAGTGTAPLYDGTSFNGHPTIYLDGTHIYGVSFDLADYPELQGQYVWVGGWIKVDDATAIIRWYINDGTNTETHTESVTSNTDWYRACRIIKFPATGTVWCGVRGDAQGANRGWIAMPTLAVLGAAWEDIHRNAPSLGHSRINDLSLQGAFMQSTVTTLANNATPPVSAGNIFKTGGTVTITDFDEGTVGQTIKILSAHAITITDNAAIILNGSANFVMAAGDTLTLTMFNDQVWQETSRTVN